MNNDNLVTDGAGSPPATNGNVDNRGLENVSFDNSFDAFRASLESQGVKTDHVEARPIEERELTEDDFYNNDYKSSGEFQGNVEEASEEVSAEELDSDVDSDVDSDIEAEPTAESDEEADPISDVNEAAEIDVLSYDDLYGQVKGIEINGEVYSPAQLKSILGQEVSAGKKAREAAERVKELDTRQAQLDAEAQWLEQRKEAAVQSDEMTRIAREYQLIQKELTELDPEQDLYDISLKREQMARLGERYQGLKSEVDVVNQKVEAEKVQKASKELDDRGYGYLLKDTKRAEAWTSYAKKLGMSDSDMYSAATNPSVAIAVEKARRWDEAQGKDTKKLTSSAKAPRSTGRLNQPSSAKKEAKQVQKIKSGQASKAEIEAYLMNQGRQGFKL